MARKKIYTEDETMALLIKREGRPSLKTNEKGHTITLHIGGGDSSTSARLLAEYKGSATTPIIMNPTTGKIASKADTVNIYVSAGKYIRKTKGKAAYAKEFKDGIGAAGAFLDISQANSTLRFALNGAVGQTALDELDDGSLRKVFEVTLDSSQKMWCAFLGAGGADVSDLTHLDDFTKVTVIMDSIGDPVPGVHVQTFYPVK